MSDLTSLTAIEIAERLADGSLTSRQITEAYLDRIDKLNPELHAFLSVFHETARAQASDSDARRTAGKTHSKLDGVPIALKDNLSTKGQTTTAASKILKNYKPLYDATVVKKLKAAGAVILGKLNLDEFAMGSSTENSAFGSSKNPWDLSRVPGGSSGGSAVAVAADLCAAAIGSDTGGSIRQPASFCGIVGLKPTYGTVSRYGLLAMASSLDQIGPMTKTVADAALIYQAIKGHDQFDATTLPDSANGSVSTSKDLSSITIGIPQEYFGEGMDQEVEKTVRAAIETLQKLGATIKPVSLPSSHLALAAYYVICPVEVASNMARYDGIRFGESIARDATNNSSSATDHSILDVYKISRAENIGAEVKRRIMLGTYASSAGYYDAYYNQAMKVRALIKKEFEAVFREVDLLATPVSPTVAFKFGEHTEDPLSMYLADINTVPINPAGVPAISVPCGFVEKEGKKLPVGLQLIGGHLADALVLNAAERYEQATRWRSVKPPLEEE